MGFILTKIRLKEQIEKLPEEFSLEELFEKIILINKIDSGNIQSKKEETITEKKLENEIEKWFE